MENKKEKQVVCGCVNLSDINNKMVESTEKMLEIYSLISDFSCVNNLVYSGLFEEQNKNQEEKEDKASKSDFKIGIVEKYLSSIATFSYFSARLLGSIKSSLEKNNQVGVNPDNSLNWVDWLSIGASVITIPAGLATIWGVIAEAGTEMLFGLLANLVLFLGNGILGVVTSPISIFVAIILGAVGLIVMLLNYLWGTTYSFWGVILGVLSAVVTFIVNVFILFARLFWNLIELICNLFNGIFIQDFVGALHSLFQIIGDIIGFVDKLIGTNFAKDWDEWSNKVYDEGISERAKKKVDFGEERLQYLSYKNSYNMGYDLGASFFDSDSKTEEFQSTSNVTKTYEQPYVAQPSLPNNNPNYITNSAQNFEMNSPQTYGLTTDDIEYILSSTQNDDLESVLANQKETYSNCYNTITINSPITKEVDGEALVKMIAEELGVYCGCSPEGLTT